ncbi:hypothetical protein RclHR1_13260002 [Rhizophagus clarus]|uniref:Uncharacterized protein n=1 Tax=Rhizophagus clarus TaxID=94130 RepID=A0A2Z6R1W8_9GLOM|nr:hypothetical protein RclHR1_13260002 [Rhizophagus clarus]
MGTIGTTLFPSVDVMVGPSYASNLTKTAAGSDGNLLRAYFNKETLAEVHVSLNNIDKLRYLVDKAYKTIHPFGQGVIGIYHDILNPNSDLINYVRKINLYSNNGQVIITCMLDNQAKKLITLDCFQIDCFQSSNKNLLELEGLELEELEDSNSFQSSNAHHWAKGLGLALHDLDHEKSWETHLTFILKMCLIHFERMVELFYYQQPYVLSSLNKYISNIDHEIWNKSESDTNNTEAAHSMANREGNKKRYDVRCYTTIEVHDKNGIPYIHRDKSNVKRLQNSIARKISLDDKLPKSSKKRKLSPPISRTSVIKLKENHERKNISLDNEEDLLFKEIHKKNLKLELRERKIVSKECEIKA